MPVKFNRSFWKKIRKSEQAIFKSGNQTVEQLGRIGLAMAKSIAPRDTGKTAKAIRRINKTIKKLPFIEIISPNMYPHATKSERIEGGKFNLPRWMHTSPNARNHIKTGDRKYMFRTAERLRKLKKGVAEGHFNKIKIR